jgi:hypothetical protein
MSNYTLDLYNNLYDYKTLKDNIYGVSLLDILKTQRVTKEFCVKYILNSSFQILDQDKKITIHDVLRFQPHIEETELKNLIVETENQKRLGKRIYSFDDFEYYANEENYK